MEGVIYVVGVVFDLETQPGDFEDPEEKVQSQTAQRAQTVVDRRGVGLNAALGRQITTTFI